MAKLSKFVLCEVREGVAFDGLSVAPVRDGEQLRTVKAILPREIAEAAGKDAAVVLADVGDDAKPGPVTDKQVEDMLKAAKANEVNKKGPAGA